MAALTIRAITKSPFLLLMAVLICSESIAQEASLQTNRQTIRIAYPSRGINVLPLHIAHAKGFFKDENLDSEIILMRTGVAITALMTGEIDYVAALESLVRASARGQPFKGIISFVNRPNHHLVSTKEINSVRELQGKTIAISSFGGAEHNNARAILKGHGLDPDRDVKFVALGDNVVRLESMKRGLVGATTLVIPYVSIAENMGLRILDNAGEFIELSSPGLGTSDKILREKPDQVRRVVRAAVRGLLFMRQNRNASAGIMKEWLGLDDDIAGKAYDMGLKFFSEDGRPTDKGLLTSIQLEQERSGFNKKVPLSKVFDTTIIHEVLNELKK